MPSVAESLTPLVLTLDEEPNLARVLGALRWARQVVVVDSGSRDRTEAIARSFSNVAWFARPFDTHARQWSFGVHETGIPTDHVLALDADMTVPEAVVAELERRYLVGDYDGAMVAFDYAFDGRRLLGSVYPPQLRVFRRDAVRIDQHGHTQVFTVQGKVLRLGARLVHDDRKPLERWIASQLGYSRFEERRLAADSPGRLRDLLRRAGLMPLAAFAAGYLRAGGPLAGAGALRYAYERATFEALLALRLLRGGRPEEGSP